MASFNSLGMMLILRLVLIRLVMAGPNVVMHDLTKNAGQMSEGAEEVFSERTSPESSESGSSLNSLLGEGRQRN